MNNEACYNIIRDAGIRSGASAAATILFPAHVHPAELLLTLLASRAPPPTSSLSMVLRATDTTAAGSPEAFLASKLKFTTDDRGQEICLLRVSADEEVGVMMGWERGISELPLQHVGASDAQCASAKCRTPSGACAMTTRTARTA